MPWWEPLDDGYVLIETPVATAPDDAVFVVTRFAVSGDTVYSQPVHYQPTPYSSADLDTIAARAARGEPGGMVPYSPTGGDPPENWEATARALRGAMALPDFQLPIDYPWVAQDQSLWLRRWDGVSPMADWFLLDGEGRPRGKLELPSTLRISWSVGDEFWAAELDEYEVPWLVHYRIRPE
jgi:hypothetical protein